MKIVINTVNGWFQLSDDAQAAWECEESSFYEDDHKLRTNPRLVKIVERFGIRASGGPSSCLRVVEIPDGVDWEIVAVDGKEMVVDRKRIWRGE